MDEVGHAYDAIKLSETFDRNFTSQSSLLELDKSIPTDAHRIPSKSHPVRRGMLDNRAC